MTFGYHPVGTPTCLRKQEVGKPSWNTVMSTIIKAVLVKAALFIVSIVRH